MKRSWNAKDKASLLRDFLRDYCQVCGVLEEQFRRFELSGTLSYAVLRDLVGGDGRNGLFMLLKDGAHHLFRDNGENMTGTLLDWAVGYAFHECVKLMEDAFQHQHYRNRFLEFRERAAAQEERAVEQLAPLLLQTRESAGFELARIIHALSQCRELLAHYLAPYGESGQLARLLLEREDLVRSAFGDKYPQLLEALYGKEQERMPLLAAGDFLAGGRPQSALDALDKQAFMSPGLEAEAARLRERAREALGEKVPPGLVAGPRGS
ncbi:MAG: hypothetical protein LBH94_03510 [Deltaproteobacteria bacterium]|jgi:hypothetical protein|nr:hypothetical protein [Deltaproteobacteria bacterium]